MFKSDNEGQDNDFIAAYAVNLAMKKHINEILRMIEGMEQTKEVKWLKKWIERKFSFYLKFEII